MAPAKNEKNQVFLGTFIHSTKLDELEYQHQTAVFVDRSGKIVHLEQECDELKAKEISQEKLGWNHADTDVRQAKEGDFFFPGFIGKSSTARYTEKRKVVGLTMRQIHISTHLSTPTSGSLAKPPFWIG